MIAVSSFRPHKEDPEYARNQIRAVKSWRNVFQEVHYFGEREPELELDCLKVKFTETKGFPSIFMMASYAATLDSPLVTILNSDIVLGVMLRSVFGVMLHMGLPAATSYRYEYDPANPDYPENYVKAESRNKQDRGMDIFIAMPQIWGLVAKHVPPYLRIGHQTWDTWVCGYFCSQLGYGFRQFTEQRVVFHPPHGGRNTPHSHEIRNDDPCFTLAKQPSPMPL